jgi:hypothetical protein
MIYMNISVEYHVSIQNLNTEDAFLMSKIFRLFLFCYTVNLPICILLIYLFVFWTISPFHFLGVFHKMHLLVLRA